MRFVLILLASLFFLTACGSVGPGDEVIRGTETGNPTEPLPTNDLNDGRDGPPVIDVKSSQLIAIAMCNLLISHVDKVFDDCNVQVMQSPTFMLGLGVPAGVFEAYGQVSSAEQKQQVFPDMTSYETCVRDIRNLSFEEVYLKYFASQQTPYNYDDLYQALPADPSSCAGVYSANDFANLATD